jgi:hypothetical protein
MSHGIRHAAAWLVRLVGLALMTCGLACVAVGVLVAVRPERGPRTIDAALPLALGVVITAAGWCVRRRAAGAIRRRPLEPRGSDVIGPTH